MRRAVVAAAATSTLVVVLLALKPHHPADGGAGAAPPTGTAPAPSGTPHGAHGPSGGHGAHATRGAHRGRGNGTYTGDAVHTQYGTVQVEATVKAGKLTAVKVLHVPSAGGTEQQIAAHAVPRLAKEALSAHSAHIHAVSGASYTSQGYIMSLQSALDAAGA